MVDGQRDCSKDAENGCGQAFAHAQLVQIYTVPSPLNSPASTPESRYNFVTGLYYYNQNFYRGTAWERG